MVRGGTDDLLRSRVQDDDVSIRSLGNDSLAGIEVEDPGAERWRGKEQRGGGGRSRWRGEREEKVGRR